MNIKLLVGIVVAIIVIGSGVGVYFTLQKSPTDLYKQSGSNGGQDPTFNATPNNDVSFEAILKGKGTREYTATLRYDGKGNSSYSSDYGDGAFTMYMFDGEHITCYGERCFKLPDTNGDGNASEATQTYDKDDLNVFRNGATLKQASVQCGDETCSVWDVKTKTFEGTFYLDSQKRMKKVEGVKDTNTWTMDYTYKPVTIIRPANVTDSPMI